MGNDDPKCVAGDEHGKTTQQNSRINRLPIRKRHGGAGGIAAHEGDKATGDQQAGSIGHAGEKRDGCDENDAGDRALS
ncbi:hypothetical protein D3C87_2155630 [compost metagenome]